MFGQKNKNKRQSQWKFDSPKIKNGSKKWKHFHIWGNLDPTFCLLTLEKLLRFPKDFDYLEIENILRICKKNYFEKHFALKV